MWWAMHATFSTLLKCSPYLGMGTIDVLRGHMWALADRDRHDETGDICGMKVSWLSHRHFFCICDICCVFGLITTCS